MSNTSYENNDTSNLSPSRFAKCLNQETAIYADEGQETLRRRTARYLWSAAGFVSFALGVIGTILPLIPTTPFILLAAFCFARSSQKLNDWFHATKLYHTVFEGLLTRKAMTLAAKAKLLTPIFILLAISFLLMESFLPGRIIVSVIFIGHIVYFGFMVKTEAPEALVQRQDRGVSRVQ